MAEHNDSTFENSSLNDMLKNANNVKFNELVNNKKTSNGNTDADIAINDDNLSQDQKIAKINEEIQKAQQIKAQTEDKTAIVYIDAQIDALIRKKQYVLNPPNGDLSINNKSIFDKYAYIDYRRYRSDKIYKDPYTHEYLNDGIDDLNEFPSDELEKIFGIINKGGYDGNTESGFAVRYKGLEGGPYGDLTIDKIIKWSEEYPQLQLRYQDFVYCSELGHFPTNRLVILRKFKNAVPDNLFDYNKLEEGKFKDDPFGINIQPISTLITWADDKSLDDIKLQFNENWEKFGGSLKDIFSKVKDSKGSIISTLFGGLFGKTEESDASPQLLDTLIIRSILGITNNESNNRGFSPFEDPENNPNMVSGSVIRTTGYAGLTGKISFNLTFNYEMRYINGIDPGIAMLELMANCIKMGTRRSEFLVPFSNFDLNKNTKLRSILEGDNYAQINEIFKSVSNSILDIMKKIGKAFEDTTTTNKDNNVLSKTFNDISDLFISRYRERIKAALASVSGSPSGVYHVTIGNPIIPYISCGDLYPTGETTLKMGKELGYNDFPTSFSYTISLATSRERGSQELIRVFNSGRGRFYVYPNETVDPDNFGSKKSPALNQQNVINARENGTIQQ